VKKLELGQEMEEFLNIMTGAYNCILRDRRILKNSEKNGLKDIESTIHCRYALNMQTQNLLTWK
jgi:hypothetical protein